MKSRINIKLASVVAFFVIFAGCSGSGRLRYDNPQEAYSKGMEQYDKGNFSRAAEYFQGVFDFGRSHEWADDAQLMLARAYSENHEYLLAANEYTRFIQIYRTDLRVPDAEFERALTFYHQSPDYDLDQTDTEKAIEQFNLFITRYPTSDRVADAEQKVVELREKVAHKGYESAKLYVTRELYEAAALTFESVFDKYPGTSWADDALLGAMEAYISFSDESIEAKQKERLEKAVSNYDKLVQLFPDSPLLKKAEQVYGGVQDRMKKIEKRTAG